MTPKEVVRVATSNNFNCTEVEYRQLDKYLKRHHPNKYFFINSNIKTPKLLNINKHPYKAVITANPNLHVEHTLIRRLYDIRPNKVGFVRVKWLPERPPIKDLINQLLYDDFTVVLTIQRFNNKKSLQKWTDLKHYTFECNRYRLHGPALEEVEMYVDSKKEEGLRAYICDRQGLGCQGCGLCATLTCGEDVRISSLNLSSSGMCPFNCPDCYAKTMQRFAKACGNAPLKFDVIKANSKQRGTTKHIKKVKEAA